MEAGNRCFDDRVPEEVNRRIIDHSSTILLPYTERSKENLVAVATVREHSITADVLPALGGHDVAPNPHELLEAALASCTIITVQMYANRKQWPLEATDVTVHVSSETKAASTIERTIKFRGALNDEQRQRLFEIANACPIHRLLQSNIAINSTLQA